LEKASILNSEEYSIDCRPGCISRGSEEIAHHALWPSDVLLALTSASKTAAEEIAVAIDRMEKEIRAQYPDQIHFIEAKA
jgi:hypothetical protein